MGQCAAIWGHMGQCSACTEDGPGAWVQQPGLSGTRLEQNIPGDAGSEQGFGPRDLRTRLAYG
jgi:hypothetical protein